MEYKDFFSPKTLEKLNKKSAENLKTMLGDKTLMQTMVSSQQLLSQISQAEAPYKSQLEKLAVDMVKELYPIIDEEGIVLDAKIGDLSSVGSELDEIKVNKPFKNWKEKDEYYNNKIKKEFGYPIETEAGDYPFYNMHLQWDDDALKYDSEKGWLTPEEAYNHLLQHQRNNNLDEIKVNKPGKELTRKEWSELINGQQNKVENFLVKLGYPKNSRRLHVIEKNLKPNEKSQLQKILKQNLTEAISPESRRRITNAITQGAALRGAFAFYLFKEHLDDLDPSLVEKYGQILKNSFGIYDDENAIAMMLAALAQGQKSAGGSSKVILKEIKVNKPSPFKFKNEFDGEKIYDFRGEEFSLNDYEKSLIYVGNNIKHVVNLLKKYNIPYHKTYSPDLTIAINIDDIGINEIKVNKPGFNFSNLDTIVGISKVETDVFDSDTFMELVDLGSYYSFLPYGDQPFAILIPKQFIELLPDKTADLTPDYNKLSQKDIDQLKNLIHQNKTYIPILKNNLNEATSGITIRARAINFPMLVHELIKGLYELISLQGFKGSKEERQAVVDKVDLLKNEPSDLRYGKFIYDALNNIFVNSEYNDPRIREFFFADVYQLDDDEFISFIENAINEELTSAQQKWANNTLRDISIDLKADDYDATGLDEIKINKPGKTIKLNLPSDLNKEVGMADFDIIVKTLRQLNPHIPSKLFYGGGGIHDDILDDLGDDYVPLSEYLQIYFKWLYSNLAFLKNRGHYDEFFSNEDLKAFVDNALKGKWLIFDNITDFTDYDTSGLFLDEIRVNKPGKKLVIKQINPNYGRLYFEDNSWFDKSKWDNWAHVTGYIAANLYKNYCYLNSHSQPFNQQDDTDIKKLKDYLISNGIPSQLVTWYDIPRLKISNKYYNVINSNTNEIKINKPVVNPELALLSDIKRKLKKLTGKEVSPLNLKLGKYNLSGNEQGIELTWEEGSKLLSSATKQNAISFFNNILNIEPSKIYIGIVPRGLSSPAKSFYIEGNYNNTPLIIARKETSSPMAGQTYLVSPSYKDKFLKYSNKYGDKNNEEIKQNIIDNFKLGTNETKIEENKSFIEKLLESFNETVKTAIKNKTLDPNIYLPLKEYSEKTITTTIERWKEADPNTDENVAKQLIQRFDQIKSGLAQKLNIVVLPDELKKGNNYLNIDKYSYGDMVNLIKSLPENPEKVKKDAIKKFIEKEQIDRNTAQSYVARFIANRDKIKFGAKEGLEDAGFTKEEVLNYIPKRLQRQEAFLDPRNWDWASFEQMLDALFPSQKQAEEGGENLVSTDADKIYDKDGIEIYKGDDVHKCISYNPIDPETKRKKYGWCVTQIGNTNYDYYRFREASPTFYFVFDRSKNSSPQHAPFNDQWHAFVIQVLIDNKGYIITGADNRGDIPVDSWEGISKVVPSDTWAKIKGLKDYFKPISLSAVERGRKFASGKNLSVDEFKELSQDEKILYIQGKASKNGLTPDILNILPQYKINLEGRSTTLANVAIDSRQKFPYAALKDNEALAKRYAVVSSRYYPNDPLPLPFIKYLDEDSKEKYLKKYNDNLTFEYLEKFFGDKIAEDYVNEQAKKLDYLPPAAVKYIKDPKLKQLYNVYLKLFESWRFETGTNISDEELDQIQQMPEQSVTPIPIGQKQWSDLSNSERKVIIDLVEKFNKNTDYITLIYALPYVVKNGAKKYVLVPKDNSSDFYSTWVLMDEQGKVVKDDISGEIELDGVPLEALQPDDDTGYNRVYDIKELTR